MKRYWEITVDQFPGSIGQGDDGLWCGLASSTAIPSSYVIGQDASSVGYNQIYAHLGAFGKIISDNGVTTIDTNAYGVSDVICCALDDVANLYWTQTIAGATWNAGGAANPATGVGGISLVWPRFQRTLLCRRFHECERRNRPSHPECRRKRVCGNSPRRIFRIRFERHHNLGSVL